MALAALVLGLTSRFAAGAEVCAQTAAGAARAGAVRALNKSVEHQLEAAGVDFLKRQYGNDGPTYLWMGISMRTALNRFAREMYERYRTELNFSAEYIVDRRAALTSPRPRTASVVANLLLGPAQITAALTDKDLFADPVVIHELVHVTDLGRVRDRNDADFLGRLVAPQPFMLDEPVAQLIELRARLELARQLGPAMDLRALEVSARAASAALLKLGKLLRELAATPTFVVRDQTTLALYAAPSFAGEVQIPLVESTAATDETNVARAQAKLERLRTGLANLRTAHEPSLAQVGSWRTASDAQAQLESVLSVLAPLTP